jgi:peptidoglycan/LPS O-acetylase OafA/YrhL
VLPHYPGLDGLRGLAVLGVLLYHGGVGWADGGFLGVEVFFVLSGFLITSLLVTEWSQSGTIALRAFWGRRARRLLPALFCLVFVIGVYYAVEGSSEALPGLRDDGISTLLYFGNWHQIAVGSSYFAATGPVSPLQHTWSLAIEEQFYVLWPLLVLAVLAFVLRRSRSPHRSLRVLLAISVIGALASAIEVALLFDHGRGLDRVYYGTDTRAFGLLVGASLAIGLSIARRRPAKSGAGRPGAGERVLGLGSVVVLGAVLAAMHFARGSDGWLYPYGFVGLDAAAALLIAAAVLRPAWPPARLLAVEPLRRLGTISYGVYLWHFPLFLWLDSDSTGLGGTALLALRVAVTLGVSILSYIAIEQPVRRRRRPVWLIRGLAPVAAGAALASVLLASADHSLPGGVSAASALPAPPAKLRGHDGPCRVTLKDATTYGLAPLPAAQETKFMYGALGYHLLRWSGTSTKTFHTCPPKRVLLVGDSLAFTLGVPMLGDEADYGIQLADAGILGCAFTTQGQLDLNGIWTGQSAGCPTELAQWARDERALRAQAVVVELGYRDEFDWRIDGHVVHLGEPAFDASVQSQIDHFVEVLGRGGVKVLLLSVPYTHPPDLPDGSPAPAASESRHVLINSMLRSAARRAGRNVRVLNLDQTVSPGGRYTPKVNGQICRFDGVHFSIYCGELLERRILRRVRSMLSTSAR